MPLMLDQEPRASYQSPQFIDELKKEAPKGILLPGQAQIAGVDLATVATVLSYKGRGSRRSLFAGGLAGAATALIINGLSPKTAEAAGADEEWNYNINSYYPADPDISSSLGMRMITQDDGGVAFLDKASSIIAKAKYNIDVTFNNLGWYRNFQAQDLADNQKKLSPAEFAAYRRGFGLCHARAAWAVRDSWASRQPGEQMLGIPNLVVPEQWVLDEMKILGFAPIAFYYKSDNEKENLAFFRDRFLNTPDKVAAGFMADIPVGQSGEWWGHVAAIRNTGGSYEYRVARAGQSYRWFSEDVVRYAVEPVDYSDLDNRPQERPGFILRADNAGNYRSPYYFAPFVRAMYYGDIDLSPLKPKFIAFLDSNHIPYRAA